MKTSKSRIAVLFTLVLAFVCSVVLSVFSIALANDETDALEDVQIYMQQGASVRFAESSEQMGLRFVAAIYGEQYQGLQDAVANGDYADFKVGMVIIPKNYVDVEEITLASLFGEDAEKKYYWGEGDAPAGQEKIIHFEANKDVELTAINELPDFVGLKGSIVNIKDGVNSETNNVDREFVSTSYVAVQDAEGNWQYKLAEEVVYIGQDGTLATAEGGLVTRSIAEVAYQMVNDANRNPEDETVKAENASLNETYLDKCQYEIVIKEGETELSRETLRYGSSYDIPVPQVAEKYRVKNVVSVKDSSQKALASTTIAKVTASETYTISSSEEYVLMDMTEGTDVLTTTTGASNKAKWSVSTTVKYNGEDSSLKLLATSNDAFYAYGFLDRDQLMLFDEWVVRIKTGEKGCSWGNTVTIKLGNGKIVDTRTAISGWREFRFVNQHDSSRTYKVFIDGVETTPADSTTFTYGGIAICTFDITLGNGDGNTYAGEAEHALFMSDIVGINKQENKEVVIFNNGGYDAKGESDIFKLVDTGTTYSKNDLLFSESVRVKRTAYSGTGSYTAGIRDVLMGGKEVVGYKANGVEVTSSASCTVNETTIIEPIYGEAFGKTTATVISNFETAVLIDENSTADTADYINDENGKKIFSKVAHGTTQLSIADRTFHSQTKMLKVVRTDGEYMNMQLRFASAWYSNAAYTFRIEWDKLAAAAPLWELTKLDGNKGDIQAPAGSTGCTVLVVRTSTGAYDGDIYIGFSTQDGLTKVATTSGSPNYLSMMLRGQNTPWYFSNVYAFAK